MRSENRSVILACLGHGYYFRTSLVLSNNPADYQFTVGARVDDGAVFYVNGVEVGVCA